jgi:hypothetical protein
MLSVACSHAEARESNARPKYRQLPCRRPSPLDRMLLLTPSGWSLAVVSCAFVSVVGAPRSRRGGRVRR